MLARPLLVLVCAFAALSSSTAALLGLEEGRVPLFSGLVAMLLLLPFLVRPRLAQPDGETFWKLWEDEGWVSLGRARNYDWMHVQAARL